MTTEKVFTELPYGVGKVTARWLMFAGVSALLFLMGLMAYIYQLREGLVVTGMRDVGTMGGSAWGLYIAFDIYFVGVSFAGITVAALIRIFKIDYLKPIARLAEWLTIIALILGAMTVLADLGKPFRALINLPKYGRPQSPFFGSFTMVVAGYFFASLVFLYLDGRRDSAVLARIKGHPLLQKLHRLIAAGYKDTPAERARHEQASYYLALAIIPLLVIAHTSLGVIFGLQVARPGWFSALQGPSFVVLAGASGLGLLVILAAIVRWAMDEQESINTRVFAWLGKAMLVLSLIYLYMVVLEMLTNLYASNQAEREVAEAVVWGTYAPIFWVSMGGLLLSTLLLGIQGLQQRWRLSWLVLCGVLINVTAMGKRYLIVVPSQTHGMLLPYGAGAYAPTWVEYMIIIGLFGMGALFFAILIYLFPIVPLEVGRYKGHKLPSTRLESKESEPPEAIPPEKTVGGDTSPLEGSPDAVQGGGT